MDVKMPGWVVDNRTSVLREAERYRSMSPEDRLKLMAVACADALKQLRARDDAQVILAYRDPLPASSVAALARLREEALSRGRNET